MSNAGREIRLFTAEEVQKLRAPGYNTFQGYPLGPEAVSGRSTCRCCGQRIARGVTAVYVFLDLSVPVMHSNWAGNGWQATKIWMHTECTPALPSLTSPKASS